MYLVYVATGVNEVIKATFNAKLTAITSMHMKLDSYPVLLSRRGKVVRIKGALLLCVYVCG